MTWDCPASRPTLRVSTWGLPASPFTDLSSALQPLWHSFQFLNHILEHLLPLALLMLFLVTPSIPGLPLISAYASDTSQSSVFPRPRLG